MVKNIDVLPKSDKIWWLYDICSNIELEHNLNVLTNVQQNVTTIRGALASLCVDVLKRPEIGM